MVSPHVQVGFLGTGPDRPACSAIRPGKPLRAVSSSGLLWTERLHLRTQTHWGEIAGPGTGSYTLCFLRNCPTIFQGGWALGCSDQRCRRGPASGSLAGTRCCGGFHSRRHASRCVAGPRRGFIYPPPVVAAGDPLFLGLPAVEMPSLVKEISMTLAHSLMGFFFFYWSFESSFYTLSAPPLSDVWLANTSSHSVAFLSSSVLELFHKGEACFAS